MYYSLLKYPHLSHIVGFILKKRFFYTYEQLRSSSLLRDVGLVTF
jgi:hypothetical protein